MQIRILKQIENSHMTWKRGYLIRANSSAASIEDFLKENMGSNALFVTHIDTEQRYVWFNSKDVAAMFKLKYGPILETVNG